MADKNLYGIWPAMNFMVNSGTFWRCAHGHTAFNPCWRCGIYHPIAFVKHWWDCKA